MLPIEKKNQLLKIDIPYSMGIMNAHSKNTENPWHGDVNILNAMFVGSLIKGRLFLELLGLKLNHGRLDIKSGGTDIRIEELGGTRVVISDLSADQIEILRKFLISTNKHEAHLTVVDHDNLEHIKPAIQLINILLKKHLPM